MRVRIVDDVQDDTHVTAVLSLAGRDWETQIYIDECKDLKKWLTERIFGRGRQEELEVLRVNNLWLMKENARLLEEISELEDELAEEVERE